MATLVARAERLLQVVSERKLSKVMFTDEKCFTLFARRNPQNDRVWHACKEKVKIPRKRLIVPEKQFDTKIMVFADVSLFGKSRLTSTSYNLAPGAEFISLT